jgi:hypothetical protein
MSFGRMSFYPWRKAHFLGLGIVGVSRIHRESRERRLPSSCKYYLLHVSTCFRRENSSKEIKILVWISVTILMWQAPNALKNFPCSSFAAKQGPMQWLLVRRGVGGAEAPIVVESRRRVGGVLGTLELSSTAIRSGLSDESTSLFLKQRRKHCHYHSHRWIQENWHPYSITMCGGEVHRSSSQTGLIDQIRPYIEDLAKFPHKCNGTRAALTMS